MHTYFVYNQPFLKDFGEGAELSSSAQQFLANLVVIKYWCLKTQCCSHPAGLAATRVNLVVLGSLQDYIQKYTADHLMPGTKPGSTSQHVLFLLYKHLTSLQHFILGFFIISFHIILSVSVCWSHSVSSPFFFFFWSRTYPHLYLLLPHLFSSFSQISFFVSFFSFLDYIYSQTIFFIDTPFYFLSYFPTVLSLFYFLFAHNLWYCFSLNTKYSIQLAILLFFSVLSICTHTTFNFHLSHSLIFQSPLPPTTAMSALLSQPCFLTLPLLSFSSFSLVFS